MMLPGPAPGMPPGSPMGAQQPQESSQATIMWQAGQIMVDTGQGPQPVEDIGEALQAVLDAYKQGTESMPGEASYAAAFGQDKPAQQRQPTARDSAMAGRY